MKILTIPHPVLTTVAGKVTVFDDQLKKTVEEMIKTLTFQKDPEGVGLAAPQIGLSMRLFVIRPKKDKPAKVFINPEIVKLETRNSKLETQEKQKPSFAKASEGQAKLEGCLSIPKIWGQVKRGKILDIRYQDIEGNWIKKRASGFEAVVIQHEMDHLEGVLFTQRVLEQNGKLYREEGEN